MFKKLTAVALLAAATVILTACGGGGGGSSSSASSNTYTGSLTVYQGFDLNVMNYNGSTLSAGVVLNCPNTTSQVQVQSDYYDSSSALHARQIILNGSFTLPVNSVTNCTTSGMTGTINSITYKVDNNSVFTLTGISVPAADFLGGWQVFWQDLLLNTTAVVTTAATNTPITCTNPSNQAYTTGNLTANSNIVSFLQACI
jgi:hypothetical protein